jgi:DNA-directed RNA polymerase beta' subunit
MQQQQQHPPLPPPPSTKSSSAPANRIHKSHPLYDRYRQHNKKENDKTTTTEQVTLNSIRFGLYTPEAIKAGATVQLTNPSFAEYPRGGPHDVAMGPVSRSYKCIACRNDLSRCPSHNGYVALGSEEVPISIASPYFHKEIEDILQLVCLCCGQFYFPVTPALREKLMGLLPAYRLNYLMKKYGKNDQITYCGQIQRNIEQKNLDDRERRESAKKIAQLKIEWKRYKQQVREKKQEDKRVASEEAKRLRRELKKLLENKKKLEAKRKEERAEANLKRKKQKQSTKRKKKPENDDPEEEDSGDDNNPIDDVDNDEKEDDDDGADSEEEEMEAGEEEKNEQAKEEKANEAVESESATEDDGDDEEEEEDEEEEDEDEEEDDEDENEENEENDDVKDGDEKKIETKQASMMPAPPGQTLASLKRIRKQKVYTWEGDYDAARLHEIGCGHRRPMITKRGLTFCAIYPIEFKGSHSKKDWPRFDSFLIYQMFSNISPDMHLLMGMDPIYSPARGLFARRVLVLPPLIRNVRENSNHSNATNYNQAQADIKQAIRLVNDPSAVASMSNVSKLGQNMDKLDSLFGTSNSSITTSTTCSSSATTTTGAMLVQNDWRNVGMTCKAAKGKARFGLNGIIGNQKASAGGNSGGSGGNNGSEGHHGTSSNGQDRISHQYKELITKSIRAGEELKKYSTMKRQTKGGGEETYFDPIEALDAVQRKMIWLIPRNKKMMSCQCAHLALASGGGASRSGVCRCGFKDWTVECTDGMLKTAYPCSDPNFCTCLIRAGVLTPQEAMSISGSTPKRPNFLEVIAERESRQKVTVTRQPATGASSSSDSSATKRSNKTWSQLVDEVSLPLVSIQVGDIKKQRTKQSLSIPAGFGRLTTSSSSSSSSSSTSSSSSAAAAAATSTSEAKEKSASARTKFTNIYDPAFISTKTGGGSMSSWATTTNSNNAAINKQQALTRRLVGKQGRFRKDSQGKRGDGTGRSVASGDIYQSIPEFGVPNSSMETLTISESVRPWNAAFLTDMLRAGRVEYKTHIARQDELYSTKFLDRDKEILKYDGTICRRHLVEGDPVLTNRQPTLLKHSQLPARIKRAGIGCHIGSSVKQFNERKTHASPIPICGSFGLDFDGDEINLWLSQHPIALMELLYVAPASAQFRSQHGDAVMICMLQNSCLGIYQMTSHQTFLNQTQMYRYIATFGQVSTQRRIQNYYFEKNYQSLPLPFSSVPFKKWSTAQLVSWLLPPNFNYTRKNFRIVNSVIQEPKEQDNERLTSDDVTKSVSGNLLHCMVNQLGTEWAMAWITGMQRVFAAFLADRGCTIGFNDMMPLGFEAYEQLKHQKDKLLQRADQFLAGLMEKSSAATGGKDDDDDEITHHLQKYDLKRSNDKELFLQDLTKRVSDHIHYWQKSIITDPAQQLTEDIKRENQLWLPRSNGTHTLVKSGAKVKSITLTHIGVALEQQFCNNSRLMPNLAHWSGPTSRHSLKAHGFIGNSLLDGMDMVESLGASICARASMSANTSTVPRIGYFQRQVGMQLSDLTVQQDQTTRTSSGTEIIQFRYGLDGFLASHTISVPSKFFTPWEHRDAQLKQDIATLLDIEMRVLERPQETDSDYKRLLPFHPAELLAIAQNLVTSPQHYNLLLDTCTKQHSEIVMPAANSKTYDDKTCQKQTQEFFQQCIRDGVLHSRETFKYNFLLDVVLRDMLTPYNLIHNYHLNFQTVHWLLERLRYLITRAICTSGQACGILVAQSLGEPTTQAGLKQHYSAGRRSDTQDTINALVDLVQVRKKNNAAMTLRLKSPYSQVQSLAAALATNLVERKIMEFVDHVKCFPNLTEAPKATIKWVQRQLLYFKFRKMRGISMVDDSNWERVTTREPILVIYFDREKCNRHRLTLVEITNVMMRQCSKPDECMILSSGSQHSQEMALAVLLTPQTYRSIEAQCVNLSETTTTGEKRKGRKPKIAPTSSSYSSSSTLTSTSTPVTIKQSISLWKKKLQLDVLVFEKLGVYIRGIPNVQSAFAYQDPSTHEWQISTLGSNLKFVAQLYFVDFHFCTSTYVRDVLQMFGIVATQAWLERAIMQQAKVHHHHANLISNHMTFLGELTPCNRHGLKTRIEQTSNVHLPFSFSTSASSSSLPSSSSPSSSTTHGSVNTAPSSDLARHAAIPSATTPNASFVPRDTWVSHNTSVLRQVFECVLDNIRGSALHASNDGLKDVVSRIMMGLPPPIGTGTVRCMPTKTEKKNVKCSSDKFVFRPRKIPCRPRSMDFIQQFVPISRNGQLTNVNHKPFQVPYFVVDPSSSMQENETPHPKETDWLQQLESLNRALEVAKVSAQHALHFTLASSLDQDLFPRVFFNFAA